MFFWALNNILTIFPIPHFSYGCNSLLLPQNSCSFKLRNNQLVLLCIQHICIIKKGSNNNNTKITVYKWVILHIGHCRKAVEMTIKLSRAFEIMTVEEISSKRFGWSGLENRSLVHTRIMVFHCNCKSLIYVINKAFSILSVQ